eukprot:2852095-Rhodomonas_salina.1
MNGAPCRESEHHTNPEVRAHPVALRPHSHGGFDSDPYHAPAQANRGTDKQSSAAQFKAGSPIVSLFSRPSRERQGSGDDGEKSEQGHEVEIKGKLLCCCRASFSASHRVLPQQAPQISSPSSAMPLPLNSKVSQHLAPPKHPHRPRALNPKHNEPRHSNPSHVLLVVRAEWAGVSGHGCEGRHGSSME